MDKNDIKLKDKSYDNIRDIVINKKKRYRNTRKYFKNKTYKKNCRRYKLDIKIYRFFVGNLP